ncbi:golgin subfamily A member 6-like protein 22 isoform X1 [Neltuma alba]|uniref:golgin subfamily A member 6-like protein 22 isoform X1 n=2 Tax=Neltuma alba TaxID=207710 RepID=UPI0010A46F91|nr:golgin subfamily A member 6-like protein 22 isoform X1 [Prosopis alba]XP_028806199.1 golgin subfamily A member 6-like protein 22 isoform X1 [Prosopis alba]
MFKSWSKKNKIKAVFKLQFQATQVPKMKKSALMISLVPDDVGKPTVKLEKTAVQEGTCVWENPVFESVKLVQDSKSGKIHEKIYHFVVATGSSKSGYLGEASVDFADFIAETEPLTVSLPLKFANSGAILHVTIQNVEGCTEQRNMEDGALELYNDGSLNHQLSFHSTDDSSYNVEDCRLGNTRSGYSEENANSELASSFRLNYGTVQASTKETHMRRRSNTDWSPGSTSDGSLGDWTNSLEDNHPKDRLRDHSDNASEKLKSEIASLKRQVEVSGLELESLRRQVAKESSRGQSMSAQIISLREERDVLKTKCEQLESQRNSNDETKTTKTLQSEVKDVRLQLKATREELVYEKELNSNLQIQLQKTQNSNSELLLAVEDLEAMLEQKNKEISDLSSSRKSRSITNEPIDTTEVDLLKRKIAELNGEIDTYSKQNEELNKDITELTSEYELLRKENLDISLRLKQEEAQQIMLQNENSASLATIQKLDSQVEILEGKIQQQTDEISECLVCINELESQVKSLEKELKMQAEKFEDDLNAMKCEKIEQEERAKQFEEALKKTRQNNAIASERFEEEYRMLSVEMSSKIEENEKTTKRAVAEVDELRQQNKLMEEMLQKCNQELRLITDQNELKHQELLNQINLKEKEMEQMSEELENKSKQLEEAQRHRKEKDEAFSVQMQMLRSEIKKLMAGENKLSKSMENGTVISKQEEHREINDLEKEFPLNALLSELQIFKMQHDKLKHNMHNEQVEKENMKNKISQLQGEMKKKEAELNIMEKKIKSNKGRVPAAHVNLDSKDECAAAPSSTKASTKKTKSETLKGTNATSAPNGKSEEKGTSGKSAGGEVRGAPNRSESQTCFHDNQNGECNTSKLMDEVAMLKDRNKNMEKELKEMEDRYSEISLKFAEVEGERQQLVMAVRNLKNGKKN